MTPNQKRREPSCVLNHDMIRRDLRDRHQGEMACPSRHWLLQPARQGAPDPLGEAYWRGFDDGREHERREHDDS